MKEWEKEGKRKEKTWMCLYAEESKNRCSERPHNLVLLRHPHHISSFYTMPYVHQSHLTRKSQTFFSSLLWFYQSYTDFISEQMGRGGIWTPANSFLFCHMYKSRFIYAGKIFHFLRILSGKQLQ